MFALPLLLSTSCCCFLSPPVDYCPGGSKYDMRSTLTPLAYPADGGSYNYTVSDTDAAEFFLYCDVATHCEVHWWWCWWCMRPGVSELLAETWAHGEGWVQGCLSWTCP